MIGSNIFNIFFVLGLSTLVRPLPVRAADSLHIAAAMTGSIILFVCMFTGKRRTLDRWEGWLLVVGYAAYIALVVLLR